MINISRDPYMSYFFQGMQAKRTEAIKDYKELETKFLHDNFVVILKKNDKENKSNYNIAFNLILFRKENKNVSISMNFSLSKEIEQNPSFIKLLQYFHIPKTSSDNLFQISYADDIANEDKVDINPIVTIASQLLRMFVAKLLNKHFSYNVVSNFNDFLQSFNIDFLGLLNIKDSEQKNEIYALLEKLQSECFQNYFKFELQYHFLDTILFRMYMWTEKQKDIRVEIYSVFPFFNYVFTYLGSQKISPMLFSKLKLLETKIADFTVPFNNDPESSGIEDILSVSLNLPHFLLFLDYLFLPLLIPKLIDVMISSEIVHKSKLSVLDMLDRSSVHITHRHQEYLIAFQQYIVMISNFDASLSKFVKELIKQLPFPFLNRVHRVIVDFMIQFIMTILSSALKVLSVLPGAPNYEFIIRTMPNNPHGNTSLKINFVNLYENRGKIEDFIPFLINNLLSLNNDVTAGKQVIFNKLSKQHEVLNCDIISTN